MKSKYTSPIVRKWSIELRAPLLSSDVRCPRCHSNKVRRAIPETLLKGAADVGLGVLQGFLRLRVLPGGAGFSNTTTYRCRVCGHKFTKHVFE